MRAIVVGAGASGLLHSLALRAARVRVVAVYDPDLSRAGALAELCGARAVPTLESAASADAEIAAVCSPPNVHVEQAEALAAIGRTVFVEKPVATTPAELARLCALDRCVPVVQWRAGRALRALRRAVARGELGPRPTAACDLAWGREDDYLRARATWGCGATLSVGIHALDALGWALGREIESVAGAASSDREGGCGGRETSAVAVLRFEGGATASFRVSMDGGDDATRLTLCGNGVTAHLAGGEADPTGRILRWSARHDARERLEALERETDGALGSPLLVPYIGAAIAALRDGERPGESERLPSIAGVCRAHLAAMSIGEHEGAVEPAARATA